MISSSSQEASHIIAILLGVQNFFLQLETAAEAKQKRGNKATIQRELLRVHSPATLTGKDPTHLSFHPALSCSPFLKSESSIFSCVYQGLSFYICEFHLQQSVQPSNQSLHSLLCSLNGGFIRFYMQVRLVLTQ